jgi:plastocyanin
LRTRAEQSTVDDITEGGAMITWRYALIGLVPLALLSVACGGDDGASTEIDATLDDFEFSPTEWTVAAGEEITIELENNGSVLHEFVILQPGVQISTAAHLP